MPRPLLLAIDPGTPDAHDFILMLNNRVVVTNATTGPYGQTLL